MHQTHLVLASTTNHEFIIKNIHDGDGDNDGYHNRQYDLWLWY